MPLWPSHKISTLVMLFEKGLNRRHIAATMGISKNSVIGKLYRLGYAEPAKMKLTIDQLRDNKRVRERLWRARTRLRFPMKKEKYIPKGPSLPKEAPIPPASEGVTILARRANQCAYPIAHRLFCGAPAISIADGHGGYKQTSWCDYHFDLCHRPTKKEAA